MKKFILFMFIALFAFANFACTTVGTNNQVANGDAELVNDDSDIDEPIEEPTEDNTTTETNSDEKPEVAKEPNSPEALVENLYKEEEKENTPFFQNKDRKLVDRFFTKDLADMIWKDAAAATDADVGALDFDPLYDSQDAEVAELKISKSAIKGIKATVTVTFLNFGEEQSVKYQLVKEKEAWKIEDISYGKETLKQIYKQGKRNDVEQEED